MKIELKEIPISEVSAGYKDGSENGVVGFSGKLNIRPAFQREFIYKDKQREEVINTVRKNFPLNIMYWVISNDGYYELLDGQQRTISICQYINGDFSINYQYFHNLTGDEKQQILDYKLMIYICDGSDKEKIDWFRIVNIAGERLFEQEIRNAIYTGQWLTEAKRYFSKSGCPAHDLAGIYLKGSSIRQDYLEAAIRWKVEKENKEIKDYMAEHQHDTNANELWLYFVSVINWVKVTFPVYRKEMKGLEWGIFYNKFSTRKYDPKELDKKVIELMEDEEVSQNSGVYGYLLSGDERHLNLRKFDEKIKRAVYERQNGICVHCKKHFDIAEMDADHITPWHLGGKSVEGNCQLLCKNCNRIKSGY